MECKLVPEEPTEEMFEAALEQSILTLGDRYKARLAAAPQPEHDRMTKEEVQAMQCWKGMDGAIAFHIIERHADGWYQIGEMMDAWLEANRVSNEVLVSANE